MRNFLKTHKGTIIGAGVGLTLLATYTGYRAAWTGTPSEAPPTPEPTAAVVMEEVVEPTPEPVVEEVEVVEEPEVERVGPIGEGWWRGDYGKLQDVHVVYVGDELAAVDLLFAVKDEPLAVRAVAENGPNGSAWELDELLRYVETSGYDNHYPVNVNFFSNVIEDVPYVTWIEYMHHDDVNTLLDRDDGRTFRNDWYAESLTGPVLPPLPEVDESGYAHIATVQERINYLVGMCGGVDVDWSRDSQLDILVRFRNSYIRSGIGESFKESELIWAEVMNTFLPDLGEDFTPYGGYCKDGEPVRSVPMDEVEGYQFVEFEEEGE